MEGAAKGRDAGRQDGFEHAWAESARIGAQWGVARGVVDTLSVVMGSALPSPSQEASLTALSDARALLESVEDPSNTLRMSTALASAQRVVSTTFQLPATLLEIPTPPSLQK